MKVFSGPTPTLPMLPSLRLHHLLRRRLLSTAAAAADPNPSPLLTAASSTAWTPAPLAAVSPATPDASLFHVAVDLSAQPHLAAAHLAAGQFLALRLPRAAYPIFLAISSPPPSLAGGEMPGFEFLVKRLPGTPAERLCALRPGDVVEVGEVVGSGFEVGRIRDADTVLMFATGSGISPIRSLIESGFGASRRTDVRLYFGARNLQRMAYRDRFEDWESTGVRIVPVLSRPDNAWTGEQGYVQTAFLRSKKIINPSSTGVILCGHKQMTEEITRVLVADGISKDKILKNF